MSFCYRGGSKTVSPRDDTWHEIRQAISEEPISGSHPPPIAPATYTGIGHAVAMGFSPWLFTRKELVCMESITRYLQDEFSITPEITMELEVRYRPVRQFVISMPSDLTEEVWMEMDYRLRERDCPFRYSDDSEAPW